MRPLLFLLVVLPLTSLAQGLTPGEIAKVQHEEKKALDRVAKKHGNKLPSEMTTEERRELIREQQAAVSAVHQSLEVDAKELARTSARLNLEERKQVVEATRALEEKERQAAKQEAPATEAGVEVFEGLDEGQLEQLDEPLPAEGEVQIMLPGQSAEAEPEPTEE